MPSVRISDAAARDLDDIAEWVVAHSDVETALAYVGRIESHFARLMLFPRRGRACDDIARGLRSVPFERSATVYYSIHGTDVRIERVLRAGRDRDRAFRDRP